MRETSRKVGMVFQSSNLFPHMTAISNIMEAPVQVFKMPKGEVSTSALDSELIGEVLGVIRDLAHSADMTMLMVTHEMRFAEEISDRVVLFDSREVVEQGPPGEIFKHPSHERTRLFLRAVLDH